MQKRRRSGEYADIPPVAIVAIRQKFGLSQAELAVLASSSVFQKRNGNLQARRVQAWELGESRVPLANWELLQVRLHLLHKGLATFEELASKSLATLIKRSIDVTKTETSKSISHEQRLEGQST